MYMKPNMIQSDFMSHI